MIIMSDINKVSYSLLISQWFSLLAPVVFTEPVIHLCKNTTKRYGSLDSGYHSHFRHIYRASLPPQLGGKQDDDDVD